jgi:hypothetical protein
MLEFALYLDLSKAVYDMSNFKKLIETLVYHINLR